MESAWRATELPHLALCQVTALLVLAEIPGLFEVINIALWTDLLRLIEIYIGLNKYMYIYTTTIFFIYLCTCIARNCMYIFTYYPVSSNAQKQIVC